MGHQVQHQAGDRSVRFCRGPKGGRIEERKSNFAAGTSNFRLSLRVHYRCYKKPLVRRRNYGEDEKSDDGFAALRKHETNGENYDASTKDIIARFKKWQKLCSFRISRVDCKTVTLKFDTWPKNVKAFVRDAYKLCPDLVPFEEDIELPQLATTLPKEKRLELWWD
jgi:hypothetical protein